ncbi:nicotinamide-nucleotide adenylyltransferase [Methanothrix sp.]|uniref:nicotinamide-nucleotide adenylyltransferase n=1 Tax=Methanothrix sp. TaxID=90426 RepID=UPI003C765982
MRRGFYIGRFQPYHMGHHLVLEQISREVDEIIVGIGTAQISHTVTDPFTAGERIAMIYGALRELGRWFYIIPLPDINRNAVWVSHVKSMTPPFEVVYSNNPLVVELFTEAGMEVRRPPMYRREIYSGTVIRRLMIEGGDWRHLVPDAVAKVIEEIKGVERLRNISKKDFT